MSVFEDIDIPLHSLSYLTVSQKQKLKKTGMETIGDVLSHIPLEYEKRNKIVSLQEAISIKKALVFVEVLSHNYVLLKRKERLLIIRISDGTDSAELHCYGRDFLKNSLPIGSSSYIWGNFSSQHHSKIIASSFEVIAKNARKDPRLGIVPRYSVPMGFSQITYANMIKKMLAHISIAQLHPYTPPPHILTTLDRESAIKAIHMPQSEEELFHARQTLAFDEILLFQLSLKSMIDNNSFQRNTIRSQCTEYAHTIEQSLPFALTKGQQDTIQSLQKILWGNKVMNTLLQGDVGSGKTLVALLCALSVIEAGEQVVFAVPSESLAHQHYLRITKLLEHLPIRVALLTGSIKKRQRRDTLFKLANNLVHILIGTHAVYSQDVVYHNLGFIIIDEQHRFGISQRNSLIEKGMHDSCYPDVLLMSATPIPRSLALTIYGNLHIVSLKERPAIQQSVHTRLIQHERREKVYKKILTKLDNNEQVFLIFPLIEAKDSKDQQSSTTSIEDLFPEIALALHPHRCEMLHSKKSDEEKIQLMEAFEQKSISVLVATTIIEVGIDVPNATSIVIFNAERFGLSTLHQLRGRVGRGSLPGEAILIFNEPLNDTARERLKIMYKETDGFIISEKDMKLRGPGDINQLGFRQSGSLLFQFAHVFHTFESNILQYSLTTSEQIIQQDPHLQNPAHTHIARILYKKEHTT